MSALQRIPSPLDLTLPRVLYRLIALAGGWNGKAMHQEMLFSSSPPFTYLIPHADPSLLDIFDGAMVIQALVMFIMVHPGKNLRSEDVPSVNTRPPFSDVNQRRDHV